MGRLTLCSWLQSKGHTERAVAQSSGIHEWSDRVVAMIKTGRRPDFATELRWARVAQMTLTVVLAAACLAWVAMISASMERYLHWADAARAADAEPIVTVTKNAAWCRLNPNAMVCRRPSKRR